MTFDGKFLFPVNFRLRGLLGCQIFVVFRLGPRKLEAVAFYTSSNWKLRKALPLSVQVEIFNDNYEG